MKIQKVTLKEAQITEVNGEYQVQFVNEKTYPLFLTHYALKQGKELGLVETSLFSDLLKLQGLQKLSNLKEDEQADIDPAIFENIDEVKMVQLIYLSFRGANKNSSLSLEDFLEKYHYSFDETMDLYMNLIVSLMDKDPNAFAAGLQKSTNKQHNKNQKKFNRQR